MASSHISRNRGGPDRNGFPGVFDHDERLPETGREGHREGRTTYSAVADRCGVGTQTIPGNRHVGETGESRRTATGKGHPAQRSLRGAALAQETGPTGGEMRVPEECVHFNGRRSDSPRYDP